MTFREFYYYAEAVQLLRSFWPDHDITGLGVFGWWDVYYASKALRVGDSPVFNNNRIKSANDIKFFGQSPMFEGHRQAQIKAAQICPEAAQKLAALGFPRQRSVLVLMEGEIPGKNTITGGEGQIGGEAYKMKHGIRIPLRHFNTYILLHEHAHMQWFNMSKSGKKLFVDWYNQQSRAGAEHPEYYGQEEPKLKDWHTYHINATFRNYVRYIAADALERLSERRGSNPKLYFDVHGALKKDHNQYALKEILLQHPGTWQPAKLMMRYEFTDEQGQKHMALPGTIVHVSKMEEGYLFRMRWKGISSPEMESWDMWDLVEFSIDLLGPGEQKTIKRQLAWCKKTPQGYFAPKEDVAAFGKDLHAAVLKVWPKIWEKDDEVGELNPLPAFPVEDIHGAFAAALKRKKFDDFTGYNGWSDLIEILQVVLQEKFNIGNLQFKDGDFVRKRQAAMGTRDLGRPEGARLRDFLAAKQGFPSSYGAANVDELWAETVAKAAYSLRNVTPELKKLLIQAITMR